MTKRYSVRGGTLAILIAMACAVASPAAKADPIVYVTGLGNEFGTLDLVTGAFSQITTLALPAGDLMYGMGFGADGNLYGVDSQPDANLWQINTSNGALTDLGAIGFSATDATSDASGKLFVLSQDLNAIYYTMNPPSTTPNEIGPIGFSSGGLAAVTPDGSVVYTTTQSTYDLVSINAATGATNDIGPTGFMIDNGLFVNGTLYAFDTSVNAIVTIDTSTGAATQVGTYFLPNGDPILSSAAVPEPSSLVLGLIGAVLAGSYGLARQRWRTSNRTAGRGA
jgi:hypothetical protein